VRDILQKFPRFNR